MIELLAHIGHGPWPFLLIAFLYLSLAAGLAAGVLLGKRSQRPIEPGYRAPVRDLRPDSEV